MLRVLKSINNSAIVTRPHLSATSSTPSGNARSVPAKPPSNSASRPAAFTRCPPLTTPRASASHNGSGRPALPVAITPRVAPARPGPAPETPGLLAALSLQLRRFRSPPPACLQTRPRPGPPLGARKPTRPCRPAQKNPGRRPPLATRSNRRTLAARRLAAPVVSSLPARLSHAQSAR
jgi:hypothetical protein